MSMDFNDAEPQGQGANSVIPDGTVAPVIINVRGLPKSKAGDAQGVDFEFTVIEGPYKGRKCWKWAGFKGNGSEGHNSMVNITRSFVRGILESAYGVNPADDSPEAMNARRLEDWEHLTGLAFVARFSVEEGKDYTDKQSGELKKGKDKNDVRAVTPDDPDYSGFKPAKPKPRVASGATQTKPANGASASGGQAPAWAR